MDKPQQNKFSFDSINIKSFVNLHFYIVVIILNIKRRFLPIKKTFVFGRKANSHKKLPHKREDGCKVKCPKIQNFTYLLSFLWSVESLRMKLVQPTVSLMVDDYTERFHNYRNHVLIFNNYQLTCTWKSFCQIFIY